MAIRSHCLPISTAVARTTERRIPFKCSTMWPPTECMPTMGCWSSSDVGFPPRRKLARPLAGGFPGFRLGLRLALSFEIDRYGGADEVLQGRPIDLFAFVDVDGAPDISVEAGVEQTGRVLQRGTLGKCEFDDALVGFPGADDAVVGKDRSSRRCWLDPLPLFDDLGIGLMDDGAHFGEHLPAPVSKFLDPPVDECRSRFRHYGFFHVQLQLSQLI